MPVAEHFSTEGVENGFPYCLEKYDMTDATDNPYSLTYEAWTLEQVMNFYYNINSAVILARDGTDSNATVTISESQHVRSCETDPLFDVDTNPIIKYIHLPNVVKLYDGDKTNEANLEGYAFGAPDLVADPYYPDSIPIIMRRGLYDGLSNYKELNAGTFPVRSLKTFTSSSGDTYTFWQQLDVPPASTINDIIDFTSSTALDFYTY